MVLQISASLKLSTVISLSALSFHKWPDQQPFLTEHAITCGVNGLTSFICLWCNARIVAIGRKTTILLQWPKELTHCDQNVWKYRLENTFTARFNTVVRQMREMFQWQKCLSTQWPKCLREKNPDIELYSCISFESRQFFKRLFDLKQINVIIEGFLGAEGPGQLPLLPPLIRHLVRYKQWVQNENKNKTNKESV